MWPKARALMGGSCGARCCYQGPLYQEASWSAVFLGLMSRSFLVPRADGGARPRGLRNTRPPPPGATQSDVSVDLGLEEPAAQKNENRSENKTPKKAKQVRGPPPECERQSSSPRS